MPALPQLFPYKAGPIEPVVLPDELVGVWVNKQYTFYKAVYIEGITRSDPIIVDLAAGAGLAAGGNTAVVQLLILEMPENEFGQFRAEVIDDFSALLLQGRADQRHPTHQTVARYDRFLAMDDPDGHTGEFYVHEDDFAYMQGSNLTDYALDFCRVSFWGFRYVCEEAPQYKWPDHCPNTWTKIPATAHL